MAIEDQVKGQPDRDEAVQATRDLGADRLREIVSPPMREVRKGWLSVTERRVPVEEFEKADRRRG